MGQVQRWLGIDFSGDARQWGAGVARERARVWIAEISEVEGALRLTDLRTVQELDGVDGTGQPAPPFERLVQRLARPDYRAAGIDAPFSVPARVLPSGSHRSLLALVDGLPCDGRPFPAGRSLLPAVAPELGDQGRQLYRETEIQWKARGLNVRSTTWAGARPGAPFTAACLCLLQRAGRPIWPFQAADHSALLVEAFPAAQLVQWGRPAEGYNGDDERAYQARVDLLEMLHGGLQMRDFHMEVMVASADALDAVLCAFGAMAVTENKLAVEPTLVADAEGWIAVRR